MKNLLAALLSLLVFNSASAATTDETTSSFSAPAHRVTFEFHSAFLMNLHHVLVDAAVHDGKLETLPWQEKPSAAEWQTLQNAVTFYRDNYAKRSLLFDKTMTDIKVALSVDDTRRDATGLNLPPDLIAVLNSVAPIYARGLWSIQDRSNQLWIQQAKSLDALYGAEVQAGIEHYLQHGFPLTPVRDDVVVETGDRRGAYTDEQTVLPSGRADYSGLATLEMLYHEASHINVTDTLSDAIDARLKATDRSDKFQLWHAVQFYTVGKVVQDVYKQRANLDYRPYADKNGVYQRGWSIFVPSLNDIWLPYMNGKSTLQEAVTAMVDKLPAT
ncbi:hypothetical protein [Solimicrobium silvestre]|uniref:DUF2268 domain-containing protein n=1 Tax=Solimicrobium silvestre TaxID=2099400 RepID=A0A2S9H0T3_9BURK|nr:hypothetical protein [Solimicrobium silvestre]PRC93594.1 hypothetical protein S2091_1595 [Solimicrobium silvestre]